MGWWSQNEEGSSFAHRATDGPEMVWGDGPADAMDRALDEIIRDFEKTWNRKPTRGEVEAGLGFALGGGRLEPQKEEA